MREQDEGGIADGLNHTRLTLSSDGNHAYVVTGDDSVVG